MAIDTRNKRFNCLSVARAYTVAAPDPDGAIAAQADRQQIAFSYSGILAGSVAESPIWVITFANSRQKLSGGLTATCAEGGLVVTRTAGSLTWAVIAGVGVGSGVIGSTFTVGPIYTDGIGYESIGSTFTVG